MSTNNVLHPANGQPIIVPSQDIVLGLYYLSIIRNGEAGEGKAFGNTAEIDHALAAGVITLHTKIKGRIKEVGPEGKVINRIIETTPGRMKIGELLPLSTNISYDLCNKLMTKREISKMIDAVYRIAAEGIGVFCDRIMSLGFYNAYKPAFPSDKDDMVSEPKKSW